MSTTRNLQGIFQFVQARLAAAGWGPLSEASGGSGASLPSGGTAGQVLTKQSATDGDAAWEDLIIDGGGA